MVQETLQKVADALNNLSLDNAEQALALSEQIPLLTTYRKSLTELLNAIYRLEGLSSQLECRLHLRLTELALSGSDSKEALTAATGGVAMAEPLGDEVLLTRAKLCVLRARLARNEGKALSGDLHDFALPEGFAYLAAWLEAIRGTAILAAFDVQQGKKHFKQALDLLKGEPETYDDLRYFCMINLGILGGVDGNPIPVLNSAQKMAQAHDALGEQVAVLGMLGSHLQSKKKYDQALKTLKQAIAVAEKAGMHKEAFGFGMVLARCQLASGAIARARATVLVLLDEIQARNDLSGFFQATDLMIDIYIAGKDYAEAYRIYKAAGPAIARVNPMGLQLLMRKLDSVKEIIGAAAYDKMVSDIETASRARQFLKH